MPTLRTGDYACDCCGLPYNDLAVHYARHPDCQPPDLVWDSSDDSEDEVEGGALNSFAQKMSRNVSREQVAADLSTLRYEHGLDGATLTFIKEAARRWVLGAAEEGAKMLYPRW